MLRKVEVSYLQKQWWTLLLDMLLPMVQCKLQCICLPYMPRGTKEPSSAISHWRWKNYSCFPQPGMQHSLGVGMFCSWFNTQSYIFIYCKTAKRATGILQNASHSLRDSGWARLARLVIAPKPGFCLAQIYQKGFYLWLALTMILFAGCTLLCKQSWTSRLKNLKALVTSRDRQNHQDNWIIFAAEDNIAKLLNLFYLPCFMSCSLKYWALKYQKPLLLRMVVWIVDWGCQVSSGSKWYKGFSVNQSWDMECLQTLFRRGWSKLLGEKGRGDFPVFTYKNCYSMCPSAVVSPNV